MTPPDCFELRNDMAVVIDPDGKITEIETPSLEEAQKAVGGYVEPILFRHGKVTGQVLVNEDGLRLGLKPNLKATQVCIGFANIAGSIVGTVIVLTGKKRWT